ncbi:FAD-dependent monooxygenase DEP4 [Paramyrothecium foliicola]|nr:FAD-dependent monooxygenase DEP4 [Paramyrothecium foliicola]
MQTAYDIVIVGAGWYGLGAAKAYSQMHPTESMLVLDASESCGGTWSKNRLYPGLKSNNMLGTFEYPDFPMDGKVYGVKPDGHVPGTVLHRYLTDFAHHFGIYKHIKFRHQLDLVEPNKSDGWTLTVRTPDGTKKVDAAKLIMATGLTSEPNMPQYKGTADFGAPIFHAKEFAKQAPYLKDVKTATVVGGAKSAFDVAYAFAEEGAMVDLVIRPNGQGPVWIGAPFVTPWRLRLDSFLNRRIMTWFSPCPWGPNHSLIRRFLHGTFLGRILVGLFWSLLSSSIVAQNGYNTHPELKKLKPWNSAFWIGSSISILNYDKPWFDLVRDGKVCVHIAQIDHLEKNKVILEDGTVLSSEVLVCSTGWKKGPSVKFGGLDEAGLGLAMSPEEKKAANASYDKTVLTMFPGLRNQPKLRFTPGDADPVRFYRFMVPSGMIKQKNLAYAGMVLHIGTSMNATIQGLWIAAFLGGKLDKIPESRAEVIDEIMLHTQWGKWRYPCGLGASLPDLVLDSLPYLDLLLSDLGLKTKRKLSIWKEIIEPYTPHDMPGLVEEWMKNHPKSG